MDGGGRRGRGEGEREEEVVGPCCALKRASRTVYEGSLRSSRPDEVDELLGEVGEGEMKGMGRLAR